MDFWVVSTGCFELLFPETKAPYMISHFPKDRAHVLSYSALPMFHKPRANCSCVVMKPGFQ